MKAIIDKNVDWSKVLKLIQQNDLLERLDYLFELVVQECGAVKGFYISITDTHVHINIASPNEFKPIVSSKLIELAKSSTTTCFHNVNSVELAIIPLNPRQSAQTRFLLLYFDSIPDEEKLDAGKLLFEIALERIETQEQLQKAKTLGERRLREIASLYEVGRVLEDDGADGFLTVIVEKAVRAMEAQACSLLLIDPLEQNLIIKASYGLSDEFIEGARTPLDHGIAGSVAMTGEPLLIVDPRDHPQLKGLPYEPRLEIVSSMCVPLRDEHGKVFGVLNIRRLHPALAFTHDELRIFGVWAQQAALAYTNAQLTGSLQRRVSELSSLSELTSAVLSPLDVDTLMEAVGDKIVNVVGFERCALFLCDKDDRLIPRVVRGYSLEMFAESGYRSDQGFLGRVTEELLPIVVENASTSKQPIKGFGRMLGVKQFAALPIRAKERAIGVIVADRHDEGGFITEGSVELLLAFANQAGIALENARLYQETEQKMQEFQTLAGFLDNILRSVGTGILTVNTNGLITTWNRSSEKIFSARASETLGTSFINTLENSFGKENIEECLKSYDAAVKKKSSWQYQLHWKQSDGIERDMLFSGSPLMTGDRSFSGYVVLVEDVTKQRTLERKMERMERLAEIGQLTATIAHELRNPMTSIKGAAQFLTLECDLHEPTKEFVEIILSEVNTLSQIADEFLDFARPMHIEAHPGNISALLEKTIQLLKPYLAQQKCRVRYVCEQELPIISFDPLRAGQAVRNLVMNAAQAMPEGGELLIYSDYDVERNTVEVSFRDSGQGMDTERLSRIWTPFFTTKTKGTGLGLSLVEKVMDAHGGRVSVRSEIGKGSTFTLWFKV